MLRRVGWPLSLVVVVPTQHNLTGSFETPFKITLITGITERNGGAFSGQNGGRNWRNVKLNAGRYVLDGLNCPDTGITTLSTHIQWDSGMPNINAYARRESEPQISAEECIPNP